jgi:magnesium chelatase family protein
VARYQSRLSGPLLDRIDLQVNVNPVAITELRAQGPGESSSEVRERVEEARARQGRRLAGLGVRTNAEMTPAAMRATCRLDAAAEARLAKLAGARASMSARAIDRTLKVARTIADLRGADAIDAEDISQAGTFRALEREPAIDPRGFIAAATLPSSPS